MPAARFKLDPLTIGLAVLAVAAAAAGAVMVSGHPKRGIAAFLVAVALAAGAVYASMRAARTARRRRRA